MSRMIQFSPGPMAEQHIPEGIELNNSGYELTQDISLTKEQLAVWTWLVSQGISNALKGLSQMVEHEIKVTSLDLKRLPAKNVVGMIGGPDATAVGIYLTIEGDATGHLLLLHDIKMAFQLIDIQMGLPHGTTQSIEEMGRSILGEMGNITGSFFLNALADSTNLVLMPSPPAVIVDMVGAILNVPLSVIMQDNDNALVVKATFKADGQDMEGVFLVMPTVDFMKTLLDYPRK